MASYFISKRGLGFYQLHLGQPDCILLPPHNSESRYTGQQLLTRSSIESALLNDTDQVY